MLLRVQQRAMWHLQGIVLWLVQRPGLRFLPFPYPSVRSCADWAQQVESMKTDSIWPRRHLRLAGAKMSLLHLGDWPASSRPRGLQDGIFGGCPNDVNDRQHHWLSWAKAAVHRALQQEIQAEARAQMEQGRRDLCVKELIGPRGGLPTLKADLVKLATLLHVPVMEKDRVDDLKKKVGPRSGLDDGWRCRSEIYGWASGSASAAGFEVFTANAESHPASSATGQAVTSSVDGRESSRVCSSNANGDGGGRADGDSLPMGVSHQRRTSAGVGAGAHGGAMGALGPTVPGRLESNHEGPDVNDSSYAFKWRNKPKPAISQMISQAWDRHCRDREAVSKDRYEVFSVMMEQWNNEVRDGMNETFLAQFHLGSEKMDFHATQPPFVTEVYTDTEPIAKEARRRGLRASESLTFGTGWNFLEAEDRAKAIQWVKQNKPYVVILAFPCNPWSVLLNLNANVDVQRLRDEALVLVEFAVEIALLQLNAGRHFLMENPLSSAAWKLEVMLRFLQDPRVRSVVIDMCRFGLCNAEGDLHRKPTKLVSSSQALISAMMGKRCAGQHEHAAVMGGAKVTRPAGHYTKSFAKAVVVCLPGSV